MRPAPTPPKVEGDFGMSPYPACTYVRFFRLVESKGCN